MVGYVMGMFLHVGFIQIIQFATNLTLQELFHMSKLEKVPAKFRQFRQFRQVPTSLPADDTISVQNKETT